MVDLKKIYCSKVPGEKVQHLPGGPTSLRAGSNCLFPKYTYITCDLPG